MRKVEKKLKGKFPRKTACTADLLCDKYPQGKRLQRAWLALPRVIFKVIHRGEMRIKEELYRNFNVSFFLSFSAICVSSTYGRRGQVYQKENMVVKRITTPLPITFHSWLFTLLKHERMKLNVDEGVEDDTESCIYFTSFEIFSVNHSKYWIKLFSTGGYIQIINWLTINYKL